MRVLLIALIVASVGLFWVRFVKVLDRIRRSKREPDFKLGSIAARAWNLFWEVLCQGKVIRERPLPGIAHAFQNTGRGRMVLIGFNTEPHDPARPDVVRDVVIES